MAITTCWDHNGRDIRLLTELLSKDPRAGEQKYEVRSKQLISQLPSSLRSKIPCMSSGCSSHKQLNMLPIEDMIDTFQGEAQQRVWATLSAQGHLSFEQNDMLRMVEIVAGYGLSVCAACLMEHFGQNVHLMVALGAFIIGRINPGLYQRSKRLIWIEEMIKNALSHQAGNVAVRQMWEAGMGLRRVRKAASTSNPDRPYVKRYVIQARRMDYSGSLETPSARSQHSNGYSEKSRTTTWDLRSDETAVDQHTHVGATEPPNGLSPRDLKLSPSLDNNRTPIVDRSQLVRQSSSSRRHTPADNDLLQTRVDTYPRVASSIYSGRPSASEEHLHQRSMQYTSVEPRPTERQHDAARSNSTLSLTGTDVIEMYGGSTVGRESVPAKDDCKRCSASSSGLCTYHEYERIAQGKEEARKRHALRRDVWPRRTQQQRGWSERGGFF